MFLKDFIISEKEKLKGTTLREKWEYFLDYYKGITLTILAVIAIIVSICLVIFGGKDSAITGILLNSYPIDNETALFSDFAQYAQIDTYNSEISFNTNYDLYNDDSSDDIYTMQILMAGVAANETDFFTADWETFQSLCYRHGFLTDLRDAIPEETLEALSNRLCYADNSIMTQLQEGDTLFNDVTIPDPMHPEDMDDPIPIGIDLRGCDKLGQLYPIDDSSVYIGIVCTSQNTENTLMFIQYLLDL